MSLDLDRLPPLSTWRHRDARDGFEVMAVRGAGDGASAGVVLDGHTTGVEEGQGFAVGYRIEVDDGWLTRRASLRAWWPAADGHVVCHYVCERFDADFDLVYDRSGLILDHPFLATRVS